MTAGLYWVRSGVGCAVVLCCQSPNRDLSHAGDGESGLEDLEGRHHVVGSRGLGMKPSNNKG